MLLCISMLVLYCYSLIYAKEKKMYFSEILQTGASQFTTNASKLKRKYWWKNVKVRKLDYYSFF